MTCEIAREEMIAYLQGEMCGTAKSLMEGHLATCANCRQELEEARKVLEVMNAAGEEAVVRRVDELIQRAIKEGASDIHMHPENQETSISLRIDGVLTEIESVPAEEYQLIVARIKLMADMSVRERRLPQDGRILIRQDGKDFDLRVSCLPVLYGERIVVRIVYLGSLLIGLDKLGLYPEDQQKIQDLTHQPNGLIIVTGPAGAGKTTTMYSMLHAIRNPTCSIFTVEDPIECHLPGIAQVRVDRKTGITHPIALRVIMRQDPDVIMCAEVRDVETAEMCMSASLTGHLVIMAMHTKDTVSAIHRLIDVGLAPHLIASTLIGIVAQRLLRRVCPFCRKEYQQEPDMGLFQKLTEGIAVPPDANFYRGAGCEQCRHTGYKGRTGIFEILQMTHAIAEKIAAGASEAELHQVAFPTIEGTLRYDAYRKAADGTTTVREAMRVLMGYPF